ncbi:MAG: calcium/proton exchanger, partial [bacterium]|nr:calcium/proton exchanger [bacterium]
LLVLGAAFFFGGMKHKRLKFNTRAATMGATLMVLTVTALIMPSLFDLTVGAGGGAGVRISEDKISLVISVILILAYLASLLFSLLTHKHLFPHAKDPENVSDARKGSVKLAVLYLVLATVGVVGIAEILVSVVEAAAHALGWGEIFVGIVIIAIVGNAAEHSSAVYFAWRNRTDLALTVTQGSSAQIALLIAPLICLVSHLWDNPMDLIFTPLEVGAVVLTMLITAFVTLDGEGNWFEGVLLLVVYAIIAVVFFFV